MREVGTHLAVCAACAMSFFLYIYFQNCFSFSFQGFLFHFISMLNDVAFADQVFLSLELTSFRTIVYYGCGYISPLS